MSKAAISELNSEELDHVSGGEITVQIDKGYVGIEISIGGYGVGVWVTGGSICGQVKTPHSIKSGCTA
jgi:ribosomal protein S3